MAIVLVALFVGLSMVLGLITKRYSERMRILLFILSLMSPLVFYNLA